MRNPFSRNNFQQSLIEFRHSLSYIDALPQLTLLGFVVGSVTGVIIVIFRLLIEYPLAFALPEHSENFEALSPTARCISLFIGSTILALVFHFTTAKERETSVSHVLDRMHNHQGKLPIKNWYLQFVGALTAMIFGQSVGREGPVVHLGAGAASQLAQALRLPNNSIQTLVGCGVASAISASFDTPMAGVIFAMEVLMLEYTIVGFVPVILASVMGTVISQAAFGDAAFVDTANIDISSLYEIPIMIVVGMVIAVCAGIYIRLNIFALKFHKIPIAVRIYIAGAITAMVSLYFPQIMGQGYDTVNGALLGQYGIALLAGIALAKLIVTPIVIGLGVPGGLIGPMLFIGACAGGTVGMFITYFFPQLNAQPGFYAMMGMCGMMAAALNAPLAALVTVLELTYNPNIIFPAMLVVVVACVTTRQLFGLKGVFIEQLKHSKRALDFGPAKQSLKRAGVRSVMDTRFAISEEIITKNKAKAILSKRPMWIIICNSEGRYSNSIRAADLANFIDSITEESSEIKDEIENETPINLNDIPSRNFRLGAIHESASLYEAMQSFNTNETEVLYVSGSPTPYSGDIKGIITQSSIENYYKPMEFRNAVD